MHYTDPHPECPRPAPDPDVKLAAVDVQHNQLAMKRYRVVAYPMIIVLREGKFYVYNGVWTWAREGQDPMACAPRA